MTYREEITAKRREAVRRMRAIRRLVPLMYTIAAVLIILSALDVMDAFLWSFLSGVLGWVLLIGAYLADGYVDVIRGELEDMEEAS